MKFNKSEISWAPAAIFFLTFPDFGIVMAGLSICIMCLILLGDLRFPVSSTALADEELAESVHDLDFLELQSPTGQTCAIHIMTHTELATTDLATAVQDQIWPWSGAGRKLVVTDIGPSEITRETLLDSQNGELVLDHWITRQCVAGADLLVLKRQLVAQFPRLVWQNLQPLRGSYDSIVVLVHVDSADLLTSQNKPVAVAIEFSYVPEPRAFEAEL